jgi:lipopolysaccharide/colanic/teichoic acid biosynthesis glycosyltransferase
MTFSNLVSALRRVALRAGNGQDHNLLTVRQFQQVLARERARSDRSGDRFCLLVFSPSDDDAVRALHRTLPAILRRRTRATDEIGWIDQVSIGVILPGTPPRGAWKLALDVCKTLPPAPEPLCRVYSYPSESDDLDVAIHDRRPTSEDRPVHALEMLFVQAIPWWKRAIDIAGSALALLILSPLFLLVAACIKLLSPGPVLFCQRRSGSGGRPFLIYKFRSMIVDAEQRKTELMSLNEQDGPAFKLTDDPRVTRFGQFLRDTSIDELPQLWNVLKGDMSLVGPRPLPCDESASCLDWQRRRLDVKPGLTCIWQVQGRSRVTFNEWIRMDLKYIRHQSLWQDIKILTTTVPAVLLRRGAK